MLGSILLSSAIALATIATRADAHGHLQQPKPYWKDNYVNNNWVVLIENYWDIGSGGDQVGKFKAMAKEKGKSVKDVVLDMVKDKKCGSTVIDGKPVPIPSDGVVIWVGSQGGGLTHTGPCEIYLDNKLVLHADDCEEKYKGGGPGSSQTSNMPVDFSFCKGKCTLAFYWLAFQNAQWQAYVNCVPLSGGGSAANAQGTNSSSTETKKPKDSKQTTEATLTKGQQSPEEQSEETQSTEYSTGDTPETPAAKNLSKTPEAKTTPTEAPPAKKPSETPEVKTPSPAETPPAKNPSTTPEVKTPSPAEAPPANNPSETPEVKTPSSGEASAAKADTKCKAPARRLRKKTVAA